MKKYFIPLFLIIFIAPSVAFASWWNPFSWFKKTGINESIIVKKEEVISNTKPKEDKKNIVPHTTKESKTSSGFDFNNFGTKSISNKKNISNKESAELIEYRNQAIAWYTSEIFELDRTIKLNSVYKEVTDVKISEIKTSINKSEGWKIGNPDISNLVDYFLSLYGNQLKLENSHLENQIKAISWMKDLKTYLENNLNNLKNISTIDGVTQSLTELENSKKNITEVKKTLDGWSDASNKYQEKLEGIIDGAYSKYNSDKKYIDTTPIYPKSFSAPIIQNNKINCTSKVNFLGELETSCY